MNFKTLKGSKTGSPIDVNLDHVETMQWVEAVEIPPIVTKAHTVLHMVSGNTVRVCETPEELRKHINGMSFVDMGPR